ncbi:MAG TPA: Mpo1-like protein [Candidatus Methylomirabilis sp.]|nr:Mpo1-like protein [Candidatus Methylomirabilis sp.]
MSIPALLKWQWAGYARYHQDRTNLLLHICAVPLFLVGTVLGVVALVALSPVLLAVALAGIVLSVIVQGRGHRLEAVPPEPFTGPANFAGRLFLEQWVTFPRFVLSGGWSRNLARSGKR